MYPAQCVILAGGLATRMRPMTETIPKVLLDCDGRPFADYQLRWLAKHGVSEAIYCIGHMGQKVREYVGDGSRWGLRVTYVDEGKELRGTAGAVRLAAELGVLQDRFLLTYGDSFLPVDFGKVFLQFSTQNLPALMTIYKNQGLWDRSNVCFEKGVVRLYDKMGFEKTLPCPMEYIDYGLLGFDRELILNEIPAQTKSDLADLLYRLSKRGELMGLESKERFYEIGSPTGLEDFKAFVRTSAML